MTDTINGWKPPVIYDIATDTMRIATQGDIDSMQRAMNALFLFRNVVKDAVRICDDALKPSAPSDRP